MILVTKFKYLLLKKENKIYKIKIINYFYKILNSEFVFTLFWEIRYDTK